MMKKVLILCLFAALIIPAAAIAQESEGQTEDQQAPEPVRPALLVIDIQNEYIPMMDERGRSGAMRTINGAIWQFRHRGLPVIRVYHTDPQWGPEPGSEGFEFPGSVIIEESDPKIVKNHASAFMKTGLDDLLEEKGVNTVFLCGLSATGCVLATYFGAQEREYNVFMVEGALLSGDAAHTEVIKDILDSVTWGGLDLILSAAVR